MYAQRDEKRKHSVQLCILDQWDVAEGQGLMPEHRI